jgi:hypothetical protein
MFDIKDLSMFGEMVLRMRFVSAPRDLKPPG